MFKLLVVLTVTFLLNSAGHAAGAASIESLSATEQGDVFAANLVFASEVGALSPKIDFINETIQVDIPNAKVKDGKITAKVDGDRIKSLLAYQLNKSTARFRMILQKGFKAERYRDSLATSSTGTGFSINLKDLAKSDELSGASAIVKNAPQELNASPEAAQIDEVGIEAELSALSKQKVNTAVAEKTIPASEAKSASADTAAKPAKEEEIPVLSNTSEKKVKASGVSGLRLSLGLAVVALFLFGMWVAAQRWLNKKGIKNAHTNIRVMTQHHLGPKKSLAIITVAGESILIGITDHNISLIKTLSLLDEELPQEMPQNFSQSLSQAEDSSSGESVEDFAMKGVKDIVSGKLKGMRNLW